LLQEERKLKKSNKPLPNNNKIKPALFLLT